MSMSGGGFKRKSKVASEIPDSSLADIAFLLLIFFMVTTVFKTESKREITMPEAEATQKVDEKRKNIIHLWVEPNGDVFMNDALVALENISDIVRPLYVSTDQQLVVAIRADQSVQYSVINDISEELREGGALRVNFATDFEDRLSSVRR